MSDSKILKVSTLSEYQREQILSLTAACHEGGDEGVPYPVDEEGCHYLLWESGDEPSLLIGVLGVFVLSDESAECIAYIRPDERERGYFSESLLPLASEDFADLEFVFPVRNESADLLAVLDSIGAEYDRTEYLMELRLDEPPYSDKGLTDAGVSFCAAGDMPGSFNYPPDSEVPVASCHLQRVSPDSVCLFGVEVLPEERKKGFGSAMIASLAGMLKSYGIRRVMAHVSSSNIPAVSLYEKTGFRVTETLSYYTF